MCVVVLHVCLCILSVPCQSSVGDPAYLFAVEVGVVNMPKHRLGLRMSPGTSVSGNIIVYQARLISLAH